MAAYGRGVEVALDRQPDALDPQEAAARAVASAGRSARLAQAQREAVGPRGPSLRVARHWVRDAGCHAYLSHAVVRDASVELVGELAALALGAAVLDAQPWDPGHRGGRLLPWPDEVAAPVLRHVRTVTRRSAGLPLHRAHRLLCSEVALEAHTRVVVQRSVTGGPALPDDAIPLHLLAPSAVVVHHDGAHLHWHHLVVSPRVGLLPWPLDPALPAALRALGLDATERAGWRGEAAGIRALVMAPEVLRGLRAATGLPVLP